MKTSTLLVAVLAAAHALPVHAQEAPEVAVPAVDAWPSDPYPIGESSEWVTNADYPLDAWRNEEAGEVSYELKVDRAGQVTGCKVTESTATARLKAETCRLLRERAQFEPARDKKGNAIASVYQGYVTWERREPEMGSGSFTLKVGFTLDERGAVRNCRIIERSGDIPEPMQRSFEKEPCPTSRPAIPARDAEGRPVARDVVLTVSVESTPAATAPTPAPQGN